MPEDHEHYAIRGQYDQGWLAGERVPAYLDEKDIPPDSLTETYAAVRLGIETRRWGGVPFYLRTGKRLPRRVTEIAVMFKRAPHLPFDDTDTVELGQNQLVVRVQPDEGVTLRFGSKVPGSAMEVRDVSMDFLYGESFTESSPEAYERLILDVLLGDATLFPRNEEVDASWRVVDPLEAFWQGRSSGEVPSRRVGPARRRRDAGARRPGLEAALDGIDSVGHHRQRGRRRRCSPNAGQRERWPPGWRSRSSSWSTRSRSRSRSRRRPSPGQPIRAGC